MKTVTSVTVFQDAVGMRMSATYSEIDEKGNVAADNKRFDRVLTDTATKKQANALLTFAQGLLEE